VVGAQGQQEKDGGVGEQPGEVLEDVAAVDANGAPGEAGVVIGEQIGSNILERCGELLFFGRAYREGVLSGGRLAFAVLGVVGMVPAILGLQYLGRLFAAS
jgi:hypothetical protein